MKTEIGKVGDWTANDTPSLDEKKTKPTVGFVGDLRRKQRRRERGALLVLRAKPSEPRAKPSPPVEIKMGRIVKQ